MDNAFSTLFWEATRRCNAYCTFCGSRCGDAAGAKTREAELTAGEILAAFSDVANAYDATRIMVNVTGGEPLLREDLFSVMAEAAAMGFPWGMVTNGTLLTERTVAAMAESGMRTVSVSLDGLADTHEALRRLPGAFTRIERGVRRLQEAHFLDHIQITTVVSERNIDELPALHAYLCTLGPDSWRLAPVDPIGRAADADGLVLSKASFQRFMAFLDAHAFDERLPVTLSCSHYLGLADDLYRPHRFTCEAGRHVASILANGDLYVCPNVERIPALIQGNVKTDRLPERWENGYAFFRRDDRTACASCLRCPAWARCRGDSLHTWDFAAGRPRCCIREAAPSLFPAHPPAAAEDAEKAALPPAVTEALRRQASPLSGVRIGSDSASDKCVFFTPNAADELFSYFAWGRAHPRNLSELMAGLAGRRDGERLYVAFLLPVPLEARGAETAGFSARTLCAAEDELALMNASMDRADPALRAFDGPLSLVGFVHSHPGALPATASEPDIRLHRLLRAALPDYCAFVIVNPQTRALSTYWDSPYTPVDTVLLTGDPDKWGFALSPTDAPPADA